MKANEIKVGGYYRAKVSGVETTVRVDQVSINGLRSAGTLSNRTTYHVTNLRTGRKTTFRSAAKFRTEVKDPQAPLEALRRHVTGKVESGEATPVVEVPADPQAEIKTDVVPVQAMYQVEGKQSSDPTPVSGTTPTSSPACATAESAASSPARSGLGAALSRASSPALSGSAPHVIVVARAGTGKTTTLVEGLKYMRGLPTRITPSSQQQAVWDQLRLSADARTVCFVAFNKSIATELQSRVPQGCEAMTMHSMGYRAITKALGRQEPNDWVVQDHVANILGVDLREFKRTERGVTVVSAVEKLVSLCKQNLVSDPTPDSLDELASYYGVDLNGSWGQVYQLVPKVLELCKTPKGKISFDDMIWLPVVLDLPVFRYDLLLVDEAQDLNRCQQALAKKAGSRLVLCGDPRQAIYGFAGADAQSMTRMAEELNGGHGCVTLPLTVTRRCGKVIVEEARRIVPDFEAHEDNGEGKISQAKFRTRDDKISEPKANLDYRSQVQDGDMVLCRINAPLVSECFRFIRQGRRANIQGRDIGRGLVSTVEKLKARDVADLVSKLGDWLASETAKEQAKRNPSENRINGLQDRHDCLLCFTEGLAATDPVTMVIAKINAVFTDDKESKGIRLSSIHKAKGLEAQRVFYLRVKGGPREDKMQPWEREQESNLRYVAITRAIKELVYVYEE